MLTCVFGLCSHCVDSWVVAGACADEQQICSAHPGAATLPEHTCLTHTQQVTRWVLNGVE